MASLPGIPMAKSAARTIIATASPPTGHNSPRAPPISASPATWKKASRIFPENFRVVDDACGQSRKARRNGEQPIIDVRFMTRYSAIHPKAGWGSQQLDVEVIYPEDLISLQAICKKWVIAESWHTYQNGQLSTVKSCNLPKSRIIA